MASTAPHAIVDTGQLAGELASEPAPEITGRHHLVLTGGLVEEHKRALAWPMALAIALIAGVFTIGGIWALTSYRLNDHDKQIAAQSVRTDNLTQRVTTLESRGDVRDIVTDWMGDAFEEIAKDLKLKVPTRPPKLAQRR